METYASHSQISLVSVPVLGGGGGGKLYSPLMHAC